MPPPTGLAYPGFSWSLTQHVGPVAEPGALYRILSAAHTFRDSAEYAERITDFIIASDILTPNIREDARRPQAWRDYQQVLPELGLIVSTRFTSGIEVTPIGLMFLDGSIGHSELVTTQMLRYQYPNGHKQDISPTQRRLLSSAGIAIPENRCILDSTHGVSIKPAILILRVLLEVYRNAQTEPNLSTTECVSAMLPCKTNAEWPLAYERLLILRRSAPPRPPAREHRHMQEWFRLLGLSDLFSVERGRISLSEFAVNRLQTLLDLCTFHEQSETYWTPSGDSNSLAMSWFGYYGNPDISSQWLAAAGEVGSEYWDRNYPEGVEGEALDLEHAGLPSPRISLRPFEPREVEPSTSPASIPSMMGFASGVIRRHRSSLLHEDIVLLVARRLADTGYSITEDRSSVDLLVTKGGIESILEIKTVTRRSLASRLRLGVGQLSEYRYRREQQTGSRPGGLLVTSAGATFPDWLINYFRDDVKLGLACRNDAGTFTAVTRGTVERDLES